MGRMKRQHEKRIAATPVMTLDEEYAEMFRDQRWMKTPLLPQKAAEPGMSQRIHNPQNRSEQTKTRQDVA